MSPQPRDRLSRKESILQALKKKYFRRFFLEFVAPHRGVVALLLINALVRVALGWWWPYANKTMVDYVLDTRIPSIEIGVWIILIGFSILFFNHLMIWAFNRVMFHLLIVISQEVRTKVADHMLHLQRQFYDSSHAGRLLTTAVGDPSAITHSLTGGIINTLVNVFVVIGGYFILLKMNAALTLAITVVFPVMIAAFFLLRPRMHEMSERIRENWGILTGMVSEKVSAVRVVRSFAAEEMESDKFRERVMLHRDLHVRYNRYNAAYGFINGMAIHLGYMIVFALGGSLYLQGQTTLGTLVAFWGYFGSLHPAVVQICNLPQIIAQASGSLNKVFGLLDEPIRIADREDHRPLNEPVRDIVFEDLSFRYGENLPWVLRHVNLTLTAGVQTGIIGPSGSGKSTLMALLLRFYEPTEGRILINGRDLRDWSLQSVRRSFGLVPQDVILFSGTVRQNVVYTHGDYPDPEIWEALDQAEATEFVRTSELGLETLLGERGVSLSGGQKQRLSIARALITQPQVLVLDNCTSALDSDTEKRLQETFEKILVERTAVIISHRIGSVLPCRHIIVMDAGRIVEEGTPEELLKIGGYFAGIHAQQTTQTTE